MAEVSFRLSVYGSPESVQSISNVRDALLGVATDLERSAGASIAASAADDQVSQSTDRYQIALRAWQQTSDMAAQSAGAGYNENLRLAMATNAARDAVSSATAPAGFWAQAISDAAVASESGMKATTGLGGALRGTNPQIRDAGAASDGTGKALKEHVRLTLALTEALFGQVPVVGTAANAIKGIARDVGGMQLGFTAAFIAVAAGAVVFQKFVEAANSAAETAAKAKTAIAAWDFSAAESGLRSMALDQIKSADNWDIIGKKGPLSIDSIAASMRILGGETFSRTIDKTLEWAAAFDKTWESYGRLDATAKSNIETLKAQAAQLENVKAAASFGELEQINAKALQSLKDIGAEEVRVMQAAKAKYDQEILGQIGFLVGAGKIQEALRLGATLREIDALKDKAIADKQIANDAAVTKAMRDNAVQVGEIRAKQIDDAGKLADVYARTALAAVRSGQAEVEARFAAAKADADFFGVALQGLEDYQAKRTAAMEAAGKLELDSIAERAKADHDAAQARIDALPAFSVAQQAAIRQQQIQDAENNLKLKEASDKLALDRIANENKVTDERRAIYARNLADAEQHYQALAALGQGDVAAHLTFLQRAGQDENLSWQDRQKYAKAAYDEFNALDQARFDRLKALGETTQAQEVARLADQVTRTGAASSARIKAEIDWATAAKKLREDVAAIGATLEDKAIAALKEEGYQYINNSLIAQKLNEMRQESVQLQQQKNADGLIEIDQIGKIRDFSTAVAAADRERVTPAQAIAASTKLTLDNLTGVKATVDILKGSLTGGGGVVDEFNQMTAAALGFVGAVGPAAIAADNDFAVTLENIRAKASLAGTGFVDASRDIGQEIDEMIADGRRWNQEWAGKQGAAGAIEEVRIAIASLGEAGKTTSDTLRDRLVGGIAAAKEPAVAAAEDLIKTILSAVDRGATIIGDRIYQGLIDRLKERLDAEALAS